ncbi:glucose PTS transporter subunit IIA [Mesoplasma florum]|uniref:glucose PTS transporter subunit IIA n=1 Tax=Mesoplasma florum TaxID=2151 RepID=UPI000D0231F2|nr:glucose PTS transporter subunit IIA [Mesoplasma florum]AVN59222.1 hypothetical protein CG009_03295 [Mesoplasma florum]
MEFKIYAPVDCDVKPIEECTDKIFAQKLLGEGLCIIPKNTDFYSPIEKGKVSLIFGTKHAFFMEYDQIKVLMHIGMDTVGLQGKPFDVKVIEKEKISLNTKIVGVNLKFIEKQNLSIETPIVFEQENIESIVVKKILKGSAKKGDLIGVFEIQKKHLESQINKKTGLKNLNSFKSKYVQAGEQFLKNVGESNFSQVYNCMTRLRFTVIDKQKVKEAEIKKNELVRGIIWNGNELQIVIGGEVYKVKDEITNIQNGIYGQTHSEKKEIQKPPIGKQLMSIVTGIMVPQIPMLMAVGLFAALQAMLVQFGVLQAVNEGSNPGNVDLISGLFYIMSKVGLNMIGVMFCYSTVKYFKGNTILAILVGLTLTSRFLFSGIPTPIEEAGFGDWVAGMKGTGWLIFKIGDYPILVKAYEGSVLPFIASGILIVLLDKWIKTWMPSVIDIIFRGFIIYALTVLPVLFILGPILSFVEMGASKVAVALENPKLFGLGVALFTFLWTPLVLTGIHGAIIMSIIVSTIMQNPVVPSVLVGAVAIAAFAQVGAALGVALITKNSQLRSFSWGAIVAGLFGVTEPIIYGINLPKGKPFIAGCIAAAFGGFMAGILKLEVVFPSGMGIFGFSGMETITKQLLYILDWIVTITIAAGLTILLYSEKWDEFKYTKIKLKKLNKILTNILLKQGLSKDQIKQNIESIENKYLSELKDNKENFDKYFKFIIKKNKLEDKISKLNNLEEKNKKRLFDKAEQMISKQDKYSIEKINESIQKSNDYSLSNQINKLENELIQLIKENQEMSDSFEISVEKLTKNYKNTIKELIKISNYKEVEMFEPLFFNGVNSIKINFGIYDQQNYGLTKTQKKDYKKIIKNNGGN